MRTVVSLLALALTASPLAAQQQCQRINDDGTLVTNISMGGPNLSLGMRLVAPGTFTLSAAQVHTGLVAGPASFAVWSHDAANNRPLANLSGNGNYQQSSAILWQGAALPTPITITTGQVYWLVWSMPNSSRSPQATSTTINVPYRGSFDGGLTWNGASGGTQPWPGAPYKIRLFCPHTTNPVTNIGAAKAGVGGLPTQRVLGWAAVGNELGFLLENAAPGATALFVLGVQPPLPIPLGIADLYASPDILIPFGTSGTPGRGVGSASLELRIPPGSAGFPLASQWLVLDGAAVGGVSHTDGAHVTIL